MKHHDILIRHTKDICEANGLTVEDLAVGGAKTNEVLAKIEKNSPTSLAYLASFLDTSPKLLKERVKRHYEVVQNKRRRPNDGQK